MAHRSSSATSNPQCFSSRNNRKNLAIVIWGFVCRSTVILKSPPYFSVRVGVQEAERTIEGYWMRICFVSYSQRKWYSTTIVLEVSNWKFEMRGSESSCDYLQCLQISTQNPTISLIQTKNGSCTESGASTTIWLLSTCETQSHYSLTILWV